jgi:hypothetical protein
MSPDTEDTLRKHLDAVDRIERRFKRVLVFAGLSSIVAYGSFFYLSAHGADIRMLLTFVVVTSAMGSAAAATGLHYRLMQMTNAILKAIELSVRDRH